jgi:hypothetical protein
MGVYGDMSFNPSDEKPLSAYTNEELLEFCNIKVSEDEYFRNYNYNAEQRREYLLEIAEEKISLFLDRENYLFDIKYSIM